MADDSERETSRSNLLVLFNEWDKKAGYYGSVFYGTALVKSSETWANVITYIFPLQVGETRTVQPAANYGDLIIASGCMELDDAKTVLQGVIQHGELCLPDDLPAAQCPARLEPYRSKRFCWSQDRRFPISYPYQEYEFDAPDVPTLSLPHGHLCSLDLPLYPTAVAAIEDMLQPRLDHTTGLHSRVSALVPDYRARIREVRLSNKGAQVQIDRHSPGVDEQNLLGKVYYRTSAGKTYGGDLAFTECSAAFPADDFAQDFILALFLKEGRELLDRWFFSAAFPSAAPGVVIEPAAEDLAYLILAGESEVIEFKQELPRSEKLAIPVIALSNRRGGRIIVGVSDDCKIIGCGVKAGEGPTDTITKTLRSRCEPCPPVDVAQITIEGKPLIVITVPEGRDKPYSLREGGIYIRSGASDRLATRYEIDQMYGENAPAEFREDLT